MKTSKIFWGLLVIGAGALLLLSALGLDTQYDAVRILGSCLLLAISIGSLAKFKFVLFFIPLALIAYIWRVQLGIDEMNVWLLLGAAALLGIGVSLIFRKKGHCHVHVHKNDEIGKTEEVLSENEQVTIDTSLGDHIKYIHANNLKKVNIKTNLASTKVFFDQCQVSDEGLVIQVNASLCELVLNVPHDWIIDNQVSVFAAEVNHHPIKAEGKVKVLITGSVSFAELRINYI